MTDFNHTFHPSILRAYDIRGTFGAHLVDDDATLLGYKIATYFRALSCKDSYTIGIVRDGRHSSPILHRKLVESLLSRGIHIIDYGIGPSPMGYYASFFENIDGIVVITASHNPKEDNGFKILLQGKNLCGEDLLKFAKLDNASASDVRGMYQEKNIIEAYTLYNIQALLTANRECNHQKKHSKQRIAWDFSHGAMSVIQPLIEKHIPGEHFFLCDTLDGDFPSHAPDPTLPKNLFLIKECILNHKCDIGFAFDGDGDRLVVIDHHGESIDGDRLVALLARDVLDAHPGETILADIKSSYAFSEEIAKFGGKPLLTRTGHSFIKTKMRETGALLAGEMSGHIFFADENKGYDDGFYATCRVLRFLEKTSKCIRDLNAEIPQYASTPEIKIPIPAHLKFLLIEQLQKFLSSRDIAFIDEDGVRLELDRGWWLLRASNTSEYLILRMEGRTINDLSIVKEHCKETFSKAFQTHISYFEPFL